MGNIDTRGHIVSVNSKTVGRIQSIGSIKMSRDAKEYEAINIDDVVLALGTIKTAPISMSVLYDPSDTVGAGELESAFMDGTTIPYSIELSDIITAGTGNGTTFAWSGAVITELDINQEEDGKVVASYQVKVNGKPTVTAAA